MTAINLREDDAIETMDGMACIIKIVKERHEEPLPVYNFHIKEWVSYFVGEIGFYVHNGRGHKKGLYSHLKDSQIVGKGKDFTVAQKKKMLEENMKRNGGVVKPDVTDDYYDVFVRPKKV